MIKSLTLSGFMAHAATVLDLDPGLNVLCGPNNTGKSAVVEALRGLASNPSSARHVIRHGAAEARVEALFEDGWRVAWVRRGKHALYETFAPGQDEPTVYAKLGKSFVPEDVAALVRLSPVSFENGGSVDVHLGDQRRPIFLLDQPGSVLADFLASSTESAHLMRMQDVLREKVKRGKGRQCELLREQAGAARALDRLAPLPGLNLALENLRQRGAELSALAAREPEMQRRLVRLETALGKVRDLRRRLGLLGQLASPPSLVPAARLARALEERRGLSERMGLVRAASDLLADLVPAPDLAPAAPLAVRLRALRQTAGRTAEARSRAQALAALSPPPELAPARRTADILSGLSALRVQTGRARRRTHALSGLAPAPGLAPAGEAAAMERRLRTLRAQAGLAARRAGLLTGMTAPPETTSPAPLAALIGEMDRLRQRLANGRRWLEERSDLLADRQRAISERLEAIGHCPLCGSGLDADSFLKREGRAVEPARATPGAESAVAGPCAAGLGDALPDGAGPHAPGPGGRESAQGDAPRAEGGAHGPA